MTDYAAVWSEAQNLGAQEILRHRLGRGECVIIVLQPGDGTRYRFLLAPTPQTMIVSNGGREPTVVRSGSPALYVSVLDGLGSGSLAVPRGAGAEWVLGEVEHSDGRYLKIGNPCTTKALAHAIAAVWS